MKEKIMHIFQPDEKEIESYLNTLFSDIPAGFEGGLIEVSNLYNSSFFPVTDIKAALNHVLELNNSGQNAYITPSILRPDTIETIEQRRAKDKAEGKEKKNYRALAENFYYCNVCWVDLDEIVNDEDFKKKYENAKPNAYTITSRADNKTSVHFWWLLEKPCTDKETLETTNKGIIQALSGDKGTHNCTRLMKIGGSVAWPVKNGRVTQLTQFKFTDWMPPHAIQKLAAVYPLQESAAQITQASDSLYSPVNAHIHAQNKDGFTPDQILDMLKFISADNNYFDWLSVGMALHDAGNIPFDVWDAWSAQGSKYPGRAELMKKWNSFTKGRGTSAGTLYYHAHNAGFRFDNQKFITVTPTVIKQNAESVNPETGEVIEKTAPITATNIKDIDLDNIPPREFLFGRFAARKFVSIVMAPPGAGKSIFSLQRGMHAALGQSWGDWECKKPLNVWVYNNEEDNDELNRRVKAILIDMNRGPSDFKAGNFYRNSGESRFINIAKLGDSGVIATPDYDELVEEIKRLKIDYLIIDPFAETHSVSENSNDEIKRVAALYRKIAVDCNCAVELIHHTRKGTIGNNEANAGNADTGRGGGSLIGVVRIGFTMSTMDKNEAVKLNVPENDRRWFVRLDDAKTNIKPPADRTDWLKFHSIALNNGTALIDGDNIGILRRVTEEDMKDEYGDKYAEENHLILTYAANIMIGSNVSEMNISTLAKCILANGYDKCSERSLHTKIKNAVMKHTAKNYIITEGFKCRFSYIDGKSRKDGNMIVLHKDQINDF